MKEYCLREVEFLCYKLLLSLCDEGGERAGDPDQREGVPGVWSAGEDIQRCEGKGMRFVLGLRASGSHFCLFCRINFRFERHVV